MTEDQKKEVEEMVTKLDQKLEDLKKSMGDTYTVSTKCTNCNTIQKIVIPKGTAVKDCECEVCGLHTLIPYETQLLETIQPAITYPPYIYKEVPYVVPQWPYHTEITCGNGIDLKDNNSVWIYSCTC